jgi:hypothetical protein
MKILERVHLGLIIVVLMLLSLPLGFIGASIFELKDE